MSEATHAAVVLAAGGSRRLGRAKQLLRRDGETLVHRMLRLAAATRPQRLLLVTGADSAQVADAAAGLGAGIVFNPDWSLGLSGSLQRAAAALSGFGGAVLVLGCDQPALEGAHLQALLRGAGTAASGCAATAHGDAAGIPAVVSMALMDASAQLQGDRGLGAQLTAMADAVWRMDAPELQLDIDREDDVTAALGLGLLDR
ncbi:nucleotidyltransferase family protein [Lysobacter sp. S4-A87]|uniref:nucleotidyltransferase family protein n=1 Tax=Lysobacter sp. S4-A87 TaxID=2925843 RepID=UPI001F52E7C8|nr:nucleotidyltransferase family protein [Lysobacter sp. S4-A87]UNK48615.1 nucleotidyltransferase family protein [Lysobacter sp. S4-A87]